MARQIANRAVIEKIEALARVTGLTKTGAVATAVAVVAFGKGSGHPASLNFGDLFA
jgi:uncharacterized protein with PIN domain